MVSIKESIQLTLSGLGRIVNSSAVFSFKGGLFLYDLIFGKGLENAPVRLREAFEELGATYIKLGQFIASTPSLFPNSYVQEMQKCLDNVRPLDFKIILKIIEEELKGKPEDFFQSIDPKPIASASIAQVHGAVTKNGLDVVIKVQRPDIEAVLNADMSLIHFSSLLFEKISPTLNQAGIADIISDFKYSILLEADFLMEAENIRTFEKYLLDSGESRGRVPKVYQKLTTKKILTMERLYGIPLTDPIELKKYVSNPEKALTDALDIWYGSLSSTGMFHADVHAGNLLLLKDGTIGFIDFGIVGNISKKVWNGLMLFMEGLGLNQPEKIAKGLVEMDGTAKNINLPKFTKDLDKLFDDMNELASDVQLGDFQAVTDSRINRIILDLSDIAKKNGLKIPREFALLMKQFLYFDRYVRALAPELDILHNSPRLFS